MKKVSNISFVGSMETRKRKDCVDGSQPSCKTVDNWLGQSGEEVCVCVCVVPAC